MTVTKQHVSMAMFNDSDLQLLSLRLLYCVTRLVWKIMPSGANTTRKGFINKRAVWFARSEALTTVEDQTR